MEASEERPKPAWLPSGVDPDALLDRLRGLKDSKFRESPGEAVAALRENVVALKERHLGGAGGQGADGSTGAAAATEAAGATVPTPPFEERPELYVGAAFAGGLALAGVLRLLGR